MSSPIPQVVRVSKEPIQLSTRLGLRPAEVAKALGVSERTVRQFLHELPHLRMGTTVVVPVDALRTWLQEKAQAEVNRVDAVVEKVLSEID